MLAEIGYPEIRVPHLRVFLYTPEESGIRMSSLAERLQLTPGAVTQLVAYLELHGLAERVRDQADGRAVIVRPTIKTRRGYAASRARVAELVDAMRTAAGAERWEVFVDVLNETVDWQEQRLAVARPANARRRLPKRLKAQGDGDDDRGAQPADALETDR